MDILYAPWREEYFNKKDGECVFCEIAKNKDLDNSNRVIFRHSELFIVMNKFPYTPGHILIVPNTHIDSPEKLDRKIWLKMFEIAQDSMQILYDYGASGINLGMNIKESGGAGIPAHLHLHLLPRWRGDTNFLTSIAQTRNYGINFDEVYKRMKDLAQKHLEK